MGLLFNLRIRIKLVIKSWGVTAIISLAKLLRITFWSLPLFANMFYYCGFFLFIFYHFVLTSSCSMVQLFLFFSTSSRSIHNFIYISTKFTLVESLTSTGIDQNTWNIGVTASVCIMIQDFLNKVEWYSKLCKHILLLWVLYVYILSFCAHFILFNGSIVLIFFHLL